MLLQQALPPVRNVDPTKEHPENKKPRKDAQDKITVKIPRKENPIPGGDFRAWDKFVILTRDPVVALFLLSRRDITRARVVESAQHMHMHMPAVVMVAGCSTTV